MKVSVHAATAAGHRVSLDEVRLISGQSACICYGPDRFEEILARDPEDVKDTADGCRKSGHHSTYQNYYITFTLEGIPKIVAMILNNERPYNTNEKSGRYTVMSCSGREKELYDKWRERFQELIAAEYPKLSEKVVKKLAQENARCFISVLSPTTTMNHTLDISQANYLIRWMREFCKQPTCHPLKEALKPWLIELADAMADICYMDDLGDYRGRGLSFFAKRERKEEFGENFCVNKYVSFACGAHLHRSRSLDFEFDVTSNPQTAEFYVPRILQKQEDIDEYLADMRSVADLYPAGMMIRMNMRGTPENFALLVQERLCGATLPETCFAVKEILNRYCMATFTKNTFVHDFLHQFENGTKCSFGHYKCNRPCPLGPDMCFERKA